MELTSAFRMCLPAGLAEFHWLAIVEVDRWLQNDLVAGFDTLVDLNLGAKIGGDGNLAE